MHINSLEMFFTKFLKNGLLLAVLLISAGGIFNILGHSLPLYSKFPSAWLILVKVGIMLLISLQILRVIYVALVFLYTKQKALFLMSSFVAVVLGASTFSAYFSLY